MKYLALILLLTGCSSAWVVRQTKNGGTIGYQGGAFSSDSGLKKKVEALITCPDNYEFVSDELNSSTSSYVTYENVVTKEEGTITNRNSYGSGYKYNSRQVSSVPVEHSKTEYWREFTYSCP